MVTHSENPSIPVKAHYHVYPSNGRKELYAVNVDDVITITDETAGMPFLKRKRKN